MSRTPARLLPLLLVVLALLLIAASRVEPMRSVPPEADEMNNLYFSLGSPAEILARTPYDWVPGGFLIMGGWSALVGLHPFVLRWLPLLTFLIGCAFVYRLLGRWRRRAAALLGMLAYGGLGLHVFLSIYMRGYAYPLALLPCAFWLTARYFDHPSWRRALPLALVMVAMFYTQLTSAVAFAMLGLFTLFVYRARVWRWWLPGVMALPLALPEILRQRDILAGRLQGIPARDLPPLGQALADLFVNYAGSAFAVWAILLLVAAGGVVVTLVRGRGASAISLSLLVWVFGAPVAMYVLNDNLGFFSGRYSWWIALGIALLIAWGLALLPRLGQMGAGLLLAALVLAPLPPTGYYMPTLPLLENFRWLAGQWRAGDVLVRDPGVDCGTPETWEIALRVFFPNGVVFDSAARDHARIWYLARDGAEDPMLRASIRAGRAAGRFVGPPDCLFRLYEAPPDAAGVRFENGMRFHGMQVLDERGLVWNAPVVRRERDSLRVRLWWSADAPIDRDYSVGVFLSGSDGAVLAQTDSSPQVILPEGAPQETSRWQPGTFYVEERVLTTPDALSMGAARLALAVYGWWDGVRLGAPGLDETGLLPLAEIALAAW